ncbi:MAG: hypothetical protein OEU52_15090 [Xanthomonadales bacterium]|nr:hypothetical protein [Xanthomonadales bacterium]
MLGRSVLWDGITLDLVACVDSFKAVAGSAAKTWNEGNSNARNMKWFKACFDVVLRLFV